MSVRFVKVFFVSVIIFCVLSVAAVRVANSSESIKNPEGVTKLMNIARNASDPKVIADLIKNGADMNAKNELGMTALMYAAYANANPEIITALIEGGADVNAKDKNETTALMAAGMNNVNPRDNNHAYKKWRGREGEGQSRCDGFDIRSGKER